LDQRQGKAKRGTLSRLTGHLDLPTVQFHQGACDAETETGATNTPGQGVLSTVEAFKELSLFFLICSQAHVCLSGWKKETPTALNNLSLYYRQLLAAQ
jgi:hypothetical protein